MERDGERFFCYTAFMNQQCVKCQAAFEVTESDMAFYDKVSPVFNGVKQLIPPPTHCPECRLRRRMSHRNQIAITMRKDSNSGKTIFSLWTDDTPFPVYKNDYYYSDNWNALDYGTDVDVEHSIFAQLTELYLTVPRPARAILNDENSDFCNNADNLKDCYLTFGASDSQDCMSCELCWYARDLLECTLSPNCELCYECIACESCYNTQSSLFSQDCSDSYFLMNCRNCKHCFGCVNLRHKEFCMFNEQLTEQEYYQRLAELDLSSYTLRNQVKERCHEFFKKHPRPHVYNISTEDSSGNFLTSCKSVHDSFFIRNSEDVKYGYYIMDDAKDTMDQTLIGKSSELVYESAVCGIGAQRILFCISCWEGISDLLYCNYCFKCQDCFGCVGLTNKQYCIFNKQYTKEEYEMLVPNIIERMKQDKEWGEFVPMSSSGMPYNQTLAQRYFPLTKVEAEAEDLQWHERDALSVQGDIPTDEHVDGYPEVQSLTLRCETSGKIFKLTESEVNRYKKFQAPLPRKAYDERLHARFMQVGSIKLYDRTCDKTGQPIKTTIPPDSDWIVWDKDVYEQEFSG